jgi:hypothetical protein
MVKVKIGIMFMVCIIAIAVICGCSGTSSSNDQQKSPTSAPVNAPTTAPTETPAATTAASSVGLSKTNPAPIGTTVTYTPSNWASTMYGSTYKITLVEVIKGSEANDLMADVNQFETPASKSDDFLLAKFKIEITGSSPSDASYKINKYLNFKATSSDGTRVYEDNLWSYDPSIEGELYNGGSIEGWACLEAAKGESSPLIVFDRDYNGKDGIWFQT